MYVCVYKYVNIYIYAYSHMFFFSYFDVFYVSICLCLYVRVLMFMQTCKNVRMHARVHVCKGACMQVYIYMCMYMCVCSPTLPWWSYSSRLAMIWTYTFLDMYMYVHNYRYTCCMWPDIAMENLLWSSWLYRHHWSGPHLYFGTNVWNYRPIESMYLRTSKVVSLRRLN